MTRKMKSQRASKASRDASDDASGRPGPKKKTRAVPRPKRAAKGTPTYADSSSSGPADDESASLECVPKKRPPQGPTLSVDDGAAKGRGTVEARSRGLIWRCLSSRGLIESRPHHSSRERVVI